MIRIVCEEKEAACDIPLLEKTARSAFEELDLVGDALVELVIVGEEEIRKVNFERRGIDRTTDVLSFPLLNEIKPFTEKNYPFDYDPDERAVSLGSILICDAVAARQAEEYGHSVQRERAYLFLHGLLHLLGYDHIEENDKAKMRLAEEKILSSVGLER